MKVRFWTNFGSEERPSWYFVNLFGSKKQKLGPEPNFQNGKKVQNITSQHMAIYIYV